MGRKIRNKIILYYSLLIAILVVFLLVYINSLLKDSHLSIIKREMHEKLDFIELVMKNEQGPAYTDSRLKRFVQNASGIINLRITVVDTTGRVLADSEIKDLSSMDNHLYRYEINHTLTDGTGESVRFSNTLNVDMLYTAKYIHPYIFRVSKPLYEIENNLNAAKRLLLTLGLSVGILAVLFTVYISNKLTKPIKETIAFAAQFSNGDYTRRILNYSNDEIGLLQRSLNKMADTIVEKIDSLLFEQKKLQVTIESISDAIVVISNDKKILIANGSFVKLFKIDISVTDRIYYEAIRSRSLNSKIEYALSTAETLQFEEEFFNNIYLHVFITPIREEKALQGILVVLRDITEKKKIEQIKTDLVSNMSHELKTPVAIIKGYLETIEENIDNKQLVQDFIQKAIKNADRQSAIINDILKLNMLETTHELLIEKINIKEVISSCVESLRPRAAAKKIQISVELNNIKEEYKGNRFLAEEIFFNILDNSISYTNEGGSVFVISEHKDNKCTIIIRDTGIGIPEDALDRIFERFYRVDKSRSRDTGGTGLGLSIVKHAADILNWDITVSSSKNGTTFSIIY